jgi:hypothetical protein
MALKLKIDDKDIEVNPYVREVIEKVIEAIIGTLRGVDKWKKLRLEIDK